ncbi:MAG: carboxylesterase/lipase family protein [Glaciihabitans sp.]|nr:carboxylesterase/lipase family protein [Glaciihabitans sp.]
MPGEARTFDTGLGPIVGLVDGDVVRVLGVPYAMAERFEAPRPVPARMGSDASGHTEPFLAFRRSPASPQLSSPVLDSLLEGADTGMTSSEDCQALSITLPKDLQPGERLPVMVWIHGGAYVTGAGDLDLYDPRSLVVEQRVIVVAVTYRLGMFGFYGDNRDVPANLGLLDILAAVQWVHNTIEAFGGDADSVTLFGQSAGGDAIAHLMISDGAEGVFRRAIIQSSPFGLVRGRSRMEKAMVSAAGTLSLTAPVTEVLALQAVAERAARRFGLRGGMAFGTRYGSAPLPPERDADAAWRAAAPKIDLLVGHTTEETRLYVGALPLLNRLTQLPVVGPLLRWMIVRPTTYLVYGRGSHRFAARHRAAGGRAVEYELGWSPRGSRLGAAHVTDIPLLLGTQQAWAQTALVGRSHWTEVNRRGMAMRQAWADFARTGTVAADVPTGSTIRFTRR